jgi:hypothetical protein
MSLDEQIVRDKVAALSSQLAVEEDDAFLRYVHALITGDSVLNVDDSDIVDGGQDKQIDAITLAERDAGLQVFITQAKCSSSFGSNALIQLGNGLRWLFEEPRSTLARLANNALRDRILEYRSLQTEYGPSNIEIFVRFCSLGNASSISDEFNQELERIRTVYDTDTFERFSIEAWGATEIIREARGFERANRSVDADIKIRYDTNSPSLIRYHSSELKGLVCTVAGGELARVVNGNLDGSIFDLNIRRFLGRRGNVNRDIIATCTDLQDSHEFWFLNNGVTVVCRHFDVVSDPDNPHVKIRDMQIVNGCQTATAIAVAAAEGTLRPDVRVLMRIYQTEADSLVGKIVLSTNNQNRISSRDLRANDERQIAMQEAFSTRGFYYERKPREFDGTTVPSETIFTNEYVAQCYLAIVLRNPSDARTRKYKVWGELHGRVFGGSRVEPYIISALIGQQVIRWLKKSDLKNSSSDIRRAIGRRGSFHIMRIAAFYWLGSDSWESMSSDDVTECIETLKAEESALDEHIRRAVEVLVELVSKSDEFVEDMDRALKSSSLDKATDKRLYRSRAATKG